MDMSQIAFWDDDSTPTLLQGIAYGVSNFIKQAPTITWRTRVGAIDKWHVLGEGDWEGRV